MRNFFRNVIKSFMILLFLVSLSYARDEEPGDPHSLTLKGIEKLLSDQQPFDRPPPPYDFPHIYDKPPRPAPPPYVLSADNPLE